MRPIVVAFTTQPQHPGLDRLRTTCDAWGWSLDLIVSPWRGWGGRLKAVVARATTLRDSFTHVLHVDGWDVAAIGPASELGGKLFAYGKPALLLATEMACWPPDTNAAAYGERLSHWWFAHSQWCWDLSKPLPAGFTDLPDSEDDQRHLHRLVLAETEGIVLDRTCRVFQSLAHAHPWQSFFDRADGRWLNRHTNSQPLFMHGNGQTEMGWVTE